jgi:alpha-mannosidase
MKRRDVLKGLSLVAPGAIWPRSLWPELVAQQQAAANATRLATPVRGLARKDGRLMQPIYIAPPSAVPGAAVVTGVNGIEVDQRTLSPDQTSFPVFVDPVDAPKEVQVTVSAGTSAASATVKLQPVRKVTVYILPHSHHDLGYTDLQAKIEEKQMHNITLGIDLARRTAGYPEGARFVWNLEVLWGADLFMRRKSQQEKAEFIDAVRKGWISLNGMYANELTGLCRPEELLRLFQYSLELGRTCGVNVDAAMISDVPGYTWGTIAAMAQAGIRYFSPAPNWFDRIGRLMVEWQDKPFWHISPSGKEKALVWIPWSGYAFSHVQHEMSAELVGKYQDRLDSINFPYDITYERWSGHGDNAEPDPQICEFIKDWSGQYEWPRFVIASTSNAFAAFEQKYGDSLPRFKGDLTPYWEDGAGSSALETRINRNAADRLTQAEALAAMIGPRENRTAKLNEAWRNVLLYSEHTWGAGGSVTQPLAPMTLNQWEVKREFAVNAEKQSHDLLQGVLHSNGSGANPAAIAVYNSASWPRSELVVLSREQSMSGDRVRDDHGTPVPSQRLNTGELAFLAQDVPALGMARFHLSAQKPHRPHAPVTVKNGVIDNGLIRAKIDAQSGNIVEIVRHGHPGNLVDISGGETLNEFLFLQGSDISKLQTSGAATITVEESGPLVASLRVESPAPGCNSLVRTVRLIAGTDWIELSNVVDKKRAEIDPHPEDRVFAGAFSQHEGKESVQFAFPFAIPDGVMRMDIPLAEMQPEKDQLPGACKNWLPVGRWVDISNQQRGVTWVTLDAPLIEAGEVSANLLGSQRNPSVWREHIAPSQKFYSWVMNNHWGTNYRAFQEGKVEFRYALRVHGGYDPAGASRLAIALSQPLIASMAGGISLSGPLVQIEPADVLMVVLKPSDDGKAHILRLFGASGKDRNVRLRWSTPPQQIWLSDSAESRVEPLIGDIAVAGWDLVTVRAEFQP